MKGRPVTPRGSVASAFPSGKSTSSWEAVPQLTKEEFFSGSGPAVLPSSGGGQPSAITKAELQQKEIVDERSKELLSGGRALDGMAPSIEEIETQIKNIGAGRVEMVKLLTDLISSMLFVDGDLAAKTHMFSRLSKRPSDLEL